MKLVLLSGGSGKRLWPLSSNGHPKQFIKILRNEYGEYESMFQRVMRQVNHVGFQGDIIIATTKNHINLIEEQSNNSAIPLIVEPEARDTFPAISLAVTFLAQELKGSLDELICVCPVDIFADLSFFKTLKEAESRLNKLQFDLALLGIQPTYPAEKYGYIVPDERVVESILGVKQFVEKPHKEKAQELINQHALWNGGVFFFRLNLVIELLRDRGYPITYSDLVLQYHQLPKISFDYEVVEKLNKVVAISYEGDWLDLGTWDILTDKIEDSIIGNGRLCHDSENTHIINHLEIPVLGMGLKDLVIVVNREGILVSKKSASTRLKEFNL